MILITICFFADFSYQHNNADSSLEITNYDYVKPKSYFNPDASHSPQVKIIQKPDSGQEIKTNRFVIRSADKAARAAKSDPTIKNLKTYISKKIKSDYKSIYVKAKQLKSLYKELHNGTVGRELARKESEKTVPNFGGRAKKIHVTVAHESSEATPRAKMNEDNYNYVRKSFFKILNPKFKTQSTEELRSIYDNLQKIVAEHKQMTGTEKDGKSNADIKLEVLFGMNRKPDPKGMVGRVDISIREERPKRLEHLISELLKRRFLTNQMKLTEITPWPISTQKRLFDSIKGKFDKQKSIVELFRRKSDMNDDDDVSENESELMTDVHLKALNQRRINWNLWSGDSKLIHAQKVLDMGKKPQTSQSESGISDDETRDNEIPVTSKAPVVKIVERKTSDQLAPEEPDQKITYWKDPLQSLQSTITQINTSEHSHTIKSCERYFNSMLESNDMNFDKFNQNDGQNIITMDQFVTFLRTKNFQNLFTDTINIKFEKWISNVDPRRIEDNRNELRSASRSIPICIKLLHLYLNDLIKSEPQYLYKFAALANISMTEFPVEKIYSKLTLKAFERRYNGSRSENPLRAEQKIDEIVNYIHDVLMELVSKGFQIDWNRIEDFISDIVSDPAFNSLNTPSRVKSLLRKADSKKFNLTKSNNEFRERPAKLSINPLLDYILLKYAAKGAKNNIKHMLNMDFYKPTKISNKNYSDEDVQSDYLINAINYLLNLEKRADFKIASRDKKFLEDYLDIYKERQVLRNMIKDKGLLSQASLNAINDQLERGGSRNKRDLEGNKRAVNRFLQALLNRIKEIYLALFKETSSPSVNILELKLQEMNLSSPSDREIQRNFTEILHKIVRVINNTKNSTHVRPKRSVFEINTVKDPKKGKTEGISTITWYGNKTAKNKGFFKVQTLLVNYKDGRDEDIDNIVYNARLFKKVLKRPDPKFMFHLLSQIENVIKESTYDGTTEKIADENLRQLVDVHPSIKSKLANLKHKHTYTVPDQLIIKITNEAGPNDKIGNLKEYARKNDPKWTNNMKMSKSLDNSDKTYDFISDIDNFYKYVKQKLDANDEKRKNDLDVDNKLYGLVYYSPFLTPKRGGKIIQKIPKNEYWNINYNAKAMSKLPLDFNILQKLPKKQSFSKNAVYESRPNFAKNFPVGDMYSKQNMDSENTSAFSKLIQLVKDSLKSVIKSDRNSLPTVSERDKYKLLKDYIRKSFKKNKTYYPDNKNRKKRPKSLEKDVRKFVKFIGNMATKKSYDLSRDLNGDADKENTAAENEDYNKSIDDSSSLSYETSEESESYSSASRSESRKKRHADIVEMMKRYQRKRCNETIIATPYDSNKQIVVTANSSIITRQLKDDVGNKGIQVLSIKSDTLFNTIKGFVKIANANAIPFDVSQPMSVIENVLKHFKSLTVFLFHDAYPENFIFNFLDYLDKLNDCVPKIVISPNDGWTREKFNVYKMKLEDDLIYGCGLKRLIIKSIYGKLGCLSEMNKVQSHVSMVQLRNLLNNQIINKYNFKNKSTNYLKRRKRQSDEPDLYNYFLNRQNKTDVVFANDKHLKRRFWVKDGQIYAIYQNLSESFIQKIPGSVKEFEKSHNFSFVPLSNDSSGSTQAATTAQATTQATTQEPLRGVGRLQFIENSSPQRTDATVAVKPEHIYSGSLISKDQTGLKGTGYVVTGNVKELSENLTRTIEAYVQQQQRPNCATSATTEVERSTTSSGSIKTYFPAFNFFDSLTTDGQSTTEPTTQRTKSVQAEDQENITQEEIDLLEVLQHFPFVVRHPGQQSTTARADVSDQMRHFPLLLEHQLSKQNEMPQMIKYFQFMSSLKPQNRKQPKTVQSNSKQSTITSIPHSCHRNVENGIPFHNRIFHVSSALVPAPVPEVSSIRMGVNPLEFRKVNVDYGSRLRQDNYYSSKLESPIFLKKLDFTTPIPRKSSKKKRQLQTESDFFFRRYPHLFDLDFTDRTHRPLRARSARKSQFIQTAPQKQKAGLMNWKDKFRVFPVPTPARTTFPQLRKYLFGARRRKRRAEKEAKKKDAPSAWRNRTNSLQNETLNIPTTPEDCIDCETKEIEKLANLALASSASSEELGAKETKLSIETIIHSTPCTSGTENYDETTSTTRKEIHRYLLKNSKDWKVLISISDLQKIIRDGYQLYLDAATRFDQKMKNASVHRTKKAYPENTTRTFTETLPNEEILTMENATPLRKQTQPKRQLTKCKTQSRKNQETERKTITYNKEMTLGHINYKDLPVGTRIRLFKKIEDSDTHDTDQGDNVNYSLTLTEDSREFYQLRDNEWVKIKENANKNADREDVRQKALMDYFDTHKSPAEDNADIEPTVNVAVYDEPNYETEGDYIEYVPEKHHELTFEEIFKMNENENENAEGIDEDRSASAMQRDAALDWSNGDKDVTYPDDENYVPQNSNSDNVY